MPKSVIIRILITGDIMIPNIKRQKILTKSMHKTSNINDANYTFIENGNGIKVIGGRDNSIGVSLCMNCGYALVKFAIGYNIACEMGLDENTYLMLGVNKDDPSMWTLKKDNRGYKVYKVAKDPRIFQLSVSSPFVKTRQRVQRIEFSKIGKANDPFKIKWYPEEWLLSFCVASIIPSNILYNK